MHKPTRESEASRWTNKPMDQPANGPTSRWTNQPMDQTADGVWTNQPMDQTAENRGIRLFFPGTRVLKSPRKLPLVESLETEYTQDLLQEICNCQFFFFEQVADRSITSDSDTHFTSLTRLVTAKTMATLTRCTHY